jgi:hypothetical protein
LLRRIKRDFNYRIGGKREGKKLMLCCNDVDKMYFICSLIIII